MFDSLERIAGCLGITLVVDEHGGDYQLIDTDTGELFAECGTLAEVATFLADTLEGQMMMLAD